jgi:hypothetical protein
MLKSIKYCSKKKNSFGVGGGNIQTLTIPINIFELYLKKINITYGLNNLTYLHQQYFKLIWEISIASELNHDFEGNAADYKKKIIFDTMIYNIKEFMLFSGICITESNNLYNIIIRLITIPDLKINKELEKYIKNFFENLFTHNLPTTDFLKKLGELLNANYGNILARPDLFFSNNYCKKYLHLLNNLDNQLQIQPIQPFINKHLFIFIDALSSSGDLQNIIEYLLTFLDITINPNKYNVFFIESPASKFDSAGNTFLQVLLTRNFSSPDKYITSEIFLKIDFFENTILHFHLNIGPIILNNLSRGCNYTLFNFTYIDSQDKIELKINIINNLDISSNPIQDELKIYIGDGDFSLGNILKFQKLQNLVNLYIKNLEIFKKIEESDARIECGRPSRADTEVINLKKNMHNTENEQLQCLTQIKIIMLFKTCGDLGKELVAYYINEYIKTRQININGIHCNKTNTSIIYLTIDQFSFFILQYLGIIPAILSKKSFTTTAIEDEINWSAIPFKLNFPFKFDPILSLPELITSLQSMYKGLENDNKLLTLAKSLQHDYATTEFEIVEPNGKGTELNLILYYNYLLSKGWSHEDIIKLIITQITTDKLNYWAKEFITESNEKFHDNDLHDDFLASNVQDEYNQNSALKLLTEYLVRTSFYSADLLDDLLNIYIKLIQNYYNKSVSFQFGKTKKWIQGTKKGSFRRWCKSQKLTNKDGKVTMKCINKAKGSGNTKLIRKAVFAQNVGGYTKFGKNNFGGKNNFDADIMYLLKVC